MRDVVSLKRHGGLILATVLVLLLGVGCARSPESKPDVLGPFSTGEMVTVGPIELQLTGTVTKPVTALSMSEVQSVNGITRTLASEGTQYMIVSILIEDTVNGSMTESRLPPHGSPYMIADGARIDVGDMGVESRSDEAPANRLMAEFEVPMDAKSAVVFLPLGEDESTLVSFTVR